MFVILNMLTEEILKEAQKRIPDVPVNMLVMNDSIDTLYDNLRSGLRAAIQNGVQDLFSNKQVVLTDGGIKFMELENAREKS